MSYSIKHYIDYDQGNFAWVFTMMDRGYHYSALLDSSRTLPRGMYKMVAKKLRKFALREKINKHKWSIKAGRL